MSKIDEREPYGVKRLVSRIATHHRVRSLEGMGDRLLGRFVPRAEAHAACCGTCCCVQYRCRDGYMQCLYTCYAETFEGCFVYRQQWLNLRPC
jgi:hypothetical protein